MEDQTKNETMKVYTVLRSYKGSYMDNLRKYHQINIYSTIELAEAEVNKIQNSALGHYYELSIKEITIDCTDSFMKIDICYRD